MKSDMTDGANARLAAREIVMRGARSAHDFNELRSSMVCEVLEASPARAAPPGLRAHCRAVQHAPPVLLHGGRQKKAATFAG
jgi:CheY-specific phosphatase CheX